MFGKGCRIFILSLILWFGLILTGCPKKTEV